MRLQAEGVATMWSAPGDYSCMEFIPCTRSDHLGLFKEGNVAPGSLREQHAASGVGLCSVHLVGTAPVHDAQPARLRVVDKSPTTRRAHKGSLKGKR